MLDGDQAIAVGTDGSLVARDAASGATRWRSPKLPGEIGRLAVAGPLLHCGYLAGNAFYRRRDGALLGETAQSYGAPAGSTSAASRSSSAPTRRPPASSLPLSEQVLTGTTIRVPICA